MSVFDETQKETIRSDFDKSTSIDFHGEKITSDSGLFPLREVDERFGLLEKTASGAGRK